MQKWEYLSITIGVGEMWENSDYDNRVKIPTTEVINVVNQKGDEGWELTSVTSQATTTLYFKRPKT